MTPTPLPSIPPTTGRPNWWARNWKWFVPMGCLTFISLIVLFIAGTFFFVFSILKSSDVYKNAVAEARRHPAVVEALGSPIEEGWLHSGSTSVNGASGNAELAIPLSGPKGKGTLYAVATKSVGEWTYSRLVLEVKRTGERIELLPTTENIETEQ